MFKVVKTLTAWWPVKVYEPDPAKPGAFAKYEFEIEFEILDRDDVQKNVDARDTIIAEAAADTTETGLRTLQIKLDARFEADLQRVVRNWRGVIDEDEKVFPFTNENLLFLLKRNHIRDGINEAYGEAIDSGKARLGN